MCKKHIFYISMFSIILSGIFSDLNLNGIRDSFRIVSIFTVTIFLIYIVNEPVDKVEVDNDH